MNNHLTRDSFDTTQPPPLTHLKQLHTIWPEVMAGKDAFMLDEEMLGICDRVSNVPESSFALMEDQVSLLTRVNVLSQRASSGDKLALELLYVFSKHAVHALNEVPDTELIKVAATKDSWPVVVSSESNAINNVMKEHLTGIKFASSLTGNRPKNLILKRETTIKRAAAMLSTYLAAQRQALQYSAASQAILASIPTLAPRAANLEKVAQYLAGHARLMDFQARTAAGQIISQLRLTQPQWDERTRDYRANHRNLPDLNQENVDHWFSEAFKLLKALTKDEFHAEAFGLSSSIRNWNELPKSKLRDRIRDGLKDAFRDLNGLLRKGRK